LVAHAAYLLGIGRLSEQQGTSTTGRLYDHPSLGGRQCRIFKEFKAQLLHVKADGFVIVINKK